MRTPVIPFTEWNRKSADERKYRGEYDVEQRNLGLLSPSCRTGRCAHIDSDSAHSLRDCRLSQRFFFVGVNCFGTWRRTVWLVFPAFRRNVLPFVQFSGLLTSEHFSRNVGKHKPSGSELHPDWPESSCRCLFEASVYCDKLQTIENRGLSYCEGSTWILL